MGNVLIRDISDELLKRLKCMAKSHNRSLQQELKAVLENTVDRSSFDFGRRASELRKKLRKKSIPFTDSARLLRQDRAR